LNIVLRRHPQCQDREVATYLRQLVKYKNVFISDEPTRDLIQHAEAVALCNSSVGWDAILAHKPLICFGLSEYSRVAHQVYEVSDLDEIEDLASLVHPNQSDKFYYYFWHKYVVHGARGIPAKATQLIDDIFLEARNKP
jgi:capsule polysaccharide modification protein KpsS